MFLFSCILGAMELMPMNAEQERKAQLEEEALRLKSLLESASAATRLAIQRERELCWQLNQMLAELSDLQKEGEVHYVGGIRIA
jgi:hypothetical protein